MRVIQIVPGGEGGVSAFARGLAEQLARDSGQPEIFAPPWDSACAAVGLASPPGGGSFVEEGILAALAKSGGRGDLLLLHYVGYGYQRRGVPSRLARAWRSARGKAEGIAFGVVFHEIAAFGPPWRSSFWLAPLQMRIARSLLDPADRAVTSLERYGRLLGAGKLSGAVRVLPIPSTVGEPSEASRFELRERCVVVFGSSGVRERAWCDHASELAAAAVAVEAREIVDVGSGASASPGSLAGVPVRRLGELPAERVSELLTGASVGFLAYPPDYLDKSTVYGAYLAHGVLPVVAWRGPRGRGPRAGEVWVRASRRGLELKEDPGVAASRAHASYEARSLQRHAELWEELLREKCAS